MSTTMKSVPRNPLLLKSTEVPLLLCNVPLLIFVSVVNEREAASVSMQQRSVSDHAPWQGGAEPADVQLGVLL